MFPERSRPKEARAGKTPLNETAVAAATDLPSTNERTICKLQILMRV